MTRPSGPRCVFHTGFIRTEVDPRVAELWPRKPVPFGDLRRTWRLEHCATVNPYWDSDMCPYPTSDCALAFLATVQYAVGVGNRNPMGLFRKVARSDGLRRLESKPLARDRVRGPQGPGDARDGAGDPQPRPAGDVPGGPASPEPDVYRPRHRPDSVGEVLRSFNFGPRQGSANDEQAGAE